MSRSHYRVQNLLICIKLQDRYTNLVAELDVTVAAQCETNYQFVAYSQMVYMR